MQFNIRLLLAHLGGWLLFFAFILIFVSSNNHDQPVVSIVSTEAFPVFAVTFVCVYYLNSRFLFPQLYLKKHYLLYFFLFALLLCGMYFLKPVDNLIHNEASIPYTSTLSFGESLPRNDIGSPGFNRGPDIDMLSLVLFLMIWSLGSAFQIINQWRSVQERAAIAEAERANAELAFLKAQINPHFLFNTLNNIYSLAVRNSEKTADAVMKLSKIMRYLTDEATLHFVPLQSEVECISDYIELQKLRLNEKVHLDFQVHGDVEGMQIAPLILMPFIENVFKYGISNHEQSNILIQLFAENKGIRFFCQNKIFPKARHVDSTGIGLDNTKKRLALFYNDKYSLNITKADGLFTVRLQLLVIKDEKASSPVIAFTL